MSQGGGKAWVCPGCGNEEWVLRRLPVHGVNEQVYNMKTGAIDSTETRDQYYGPEPKTVTCGVCKMQVKVTQ